MKRMRILLLFLAIFVMAGSLPSEAGFVPVPGGEPHRGVVTVEMAKTLPDDVDVVLQGNIERHIRKEYYVFRDATGSITVEIDDDAWRGFVIGPQDKVEIVGEIDRDFNSIKVEVDYIRKLESE